MTLKRQKIGALVTKHLEKCGKEAVELTLEECRTLFRKVVHMSSFADFAPEFCESLAPENRQKAYEMSVKLRADYVNRAKLDQAKVEDTDIKQSEHGEPLDNVSYNFV